VGEGGSPSRSDGETGEGFSPLGKLVVWIQTPHPARIACAPPSPTRGKAAGSSVFFSHAVNDDVKTLVGSRRNEIAGELVELRIGDLKRVFAAGIALA